MSAPPPSTAAELVLRRRGDDTTGVLFEDRRWTWDEAVSEATVRASLLAGLRRPGPFHVGVLLENTPEYLFVLAGAALAGATVVGINPNRRGDELARDVRHTDCQLIVTEGVMNGLLDGLDFGIDRDRVLLCDGDPYDALLASHRPGVVPAALPHADDQYVLIFTSGSTGAPKAVRMSHGRAARAAGRMPFGSDDVVYCAMPLFHGNALAAAVLPALATGAVLALRRRFSASGFLPDIRRFGCTFFNTVGRAVAHINATPPTDDDGSHPLRWVLAPETSDADRARFTARFGVPVFSGYGSSENSIVLQPAPKARAGALGVSADGADIAVVDPETGDECPAALFDGGGRLVNAAVAVGELVGRNTVASFEGYYKDPDAEAERTRNGWYWSGDLAYRDGDGVFYFAGRTGDWLRVDSENFVAAPIERIIARAPDVQGVAVYAVPDVSTGDQVMAAIELRAGVAFDPVGFEAFVAAQPDLAPKWIPRYVRVVDALPVTGTDKIDKAPLRSDRWHTTDPIWHRPGRATAFEPLLPADRAALDAALAECGRNGCV